MFISKLTLRNYRNFANEKLIFHKGINTIIGENGCGKTNVLQAIRILTDESLPRTYRFYESDFNRSLGTWKGHWIIIQIFFDELDHGDEAQALAIHHVGHAEQEEANIGSCALVFRPKNGIRQKLYEYSISEGKNAAGLSAILETISLDDYETIYTCKSGIDFSLNENYTKYVADFKNITFPDPAAMAQDIYGSKLYLTNFTKEISCTYIKALRDVEADLRSYRDNPLINLLRGKEKSIEIKKKEDITGRIQDLNKEISNLDEVQDVSRGISNSINTSVGETYAPGISIKSELPEDMERLMQSLKLWVGDSMDDPYQGRIGELSLGGANLIYLSTKLLEYEKVKSHDKVANFLLIEEPEAHIHNHIQKTLFQKIPGMSTQVIITTHSTHISSVSKISTVNILSKFSNFVEVYNPTRNLQIEDVTRIERYLDAIRSSLLFAKGIILVEGDAELILIPSLVKTVFGFSLDEIGISLINIGSTGFRNLATLFHQDRIRKYCAIITDLDTSFIPLGDDPKMDDEQQRSARNSQKSGKEREAILKKLVDKNNFLDVFYAENTFEVQFIQQPANKQCVIEAITPHYTSMAAVKQIKEKIESTDISVYGTEILRLANKFGKGWLALLISEKLTHNNVIPRYILKALYYALPKLNINVYKSICNKRITLLYNDQPEGDNTDYKKLLRELQKCVTKEDLDSLLQKEVPNDDLTVFIAG